MLLIPDVAPPAGPAPDPSAFLAGVDRWLKALARRYRGRYGVGYDDLLQELRIEVVLHRHRFDPARGAVTSWCAWRARHVLGRLGRQWRRSPRLARLVAGREGEPDGPAAAARPDPAAAGGRAERAEDLAELTGAVRAAVARLPRAQRAAVAAVYGIGPGAAGASCTAVAARNGTTRQAVSHAAALGRKKLAGSDRLREVAERHGLAAGPGPSHTPG